MKTLLKIITLTVHFLLTIYTKTLQDLFYFSHLDEIDLTGGDMFEMNKTSYNRNSIVATVGGGPFLPFVRRSGDMADMNAQFLVDLLENNLVKKVKYIPHSMGIDHLLVPYIEPGVVELVKTSPEAYLPIPFFINGGLESAAWRIDLDTKPSTYPAGNDLKNVMKVTLHDRSASLIFKIPTDYQINSELYPYLKFRAFFLEYMITLEHFGHVL